MRSDLKERHSAEEFEFMGERPGHIISPGPVNADDANASDDERREKWFRRF